MMHFKALVCCLFALAMILSQASFAQQTHELKFADLYEYLSYSDYKQVISAKNVLVNGFDGICPDTFCEGDFSNLQSIDFECSVHTPTGKLSECLWTFAGSYHHTDTATGEIKLESHRVQACKIDVSGIHWKDFVAQVLKRGAIEKLDSSEILDFTLAGKNKTVYEQLTDCL